MKNPTLVLAALLLTLSLSPVATAQQQRIKPASVTPTSDRELDGLQGPVRRVRVETAKITVKEGQFVEGPRVLRETATYDPKGRKIDSVAHPVEGTTLPGKEEYRYDENGNIIEMTLRGDDGSILSKETYQYELDQIGNWKKMISSVAIYENGKLIFEPIEITYRTIAYYYGQAVDQLVSGEKKSAALKKTSAPAQAMDTPAREDKAPIATKVSTPTASTPTSNGNTIENTETLRTLNKSTDVPAAEDIAAKNFEHEPQKQRVDAKLSTGSPTMGSLEPPVSEKLAAPPENSLSQPAEKVSPEVAKTTAEPKINNVSVPTNNNLAVEERPEPLTKPVETSNSLSGNSGVPPASNVARTNPSSVSTVTETKPALSPAAAQYEQGLSHLAAFRYPEAVKAFSESVKLNPNEVQAYVKLGIAHSAQGQNKEAAAVLKMAVQMNRDQVDALGYYHLGRAYAALGKHSNALDSFKQSLNIMKAETIDPTKAKDRSSPPLAHVHHGMGAMYYNMQRPKEAIKELKRAIELNSKLADAYYVLALSYIELGNRTSAEAQRNILQTLDGALARKVDAALSNYNPGHCKTVFGPC